MDDSPKQSEAAEREIERRRAVGAARAALERFGAGPVAELMAKAEAALAMGRFSTAQRFATAAIDFATPDAIPAIDEFLARVTTPTN